MASVSFQNIEKTFGTTKVIHGISIDITDSRRAVDEFGVVAKELEIDRVIAELAP